MAGRGAALEGWRKAIPEGRDRVQSRALVWLVGAPLAAACMPLLLLMTVPHNAGYYALRAGIVSLTFGLVVWALRAATPAAAFFGAIICLVVTLGSESHRSYPELHSGLTPLMLLFLLTFAAGKIGRARKKKIEDIQEVREMKRGRSASQVIANLGAGAVTVMSTLFSVPVAASKVMLVAALAEATADTLSSELGSAFGGTPFLMTSFKRVEAGTDGAVSLLGTVAGIAGAALIAGAGAWAMHLSRQSALTSLAGAIAGLFFDSLLGATIERRGLLGNDWVNFLSTVFAALVALAVVLV